MGLSFERTKRIGLSGMHAARSKCASDAALEAHAVFLHLTASPSRHLTYNGAAAGLPVKYRQAHEQQALQAKPACMSPYKRHGP